MVCISRSKVSSKLPQRVQQIICQPLFTTLFTTANLKYQNILEYTDRYDKFRGSCKTFFKRMQSDDNYRPCTCMAFSVTHTRSWSRRIAKPNLHYRISPTFYEFYWQKTFWLLQLFNYSNIQGEAISCTYEESSLHGLFEKSKSSTSLGLQYLWARMAKW